MINGDIIFFKDSNVHKGERGTSHPSVSQLSKHKYPT